MTVFDEARATLPPELRALADDTIAKYREYWRKRETGEAKGWEHDHANAPYRAMTKALEHAGLDVKPPVPMEALTPVQRALIVVFSEDEIHIDHQTSVAGYARRRRRTLGIDPPGVVEELLGPKLREKYAPTEDVTEGLPEERRFEVLLEAFICGYPGGSFTKIEGLLPLAHHAGAYAAKMLPTLGHEEAWLVHWASAALFTALARSGTPVPEGADRLFPIAMHMQQPIAKERVLEHARALPEGRREAAILASMARSDGIPSQVVEAVAFVLAAIPMPDVLEKTIEHAKRKKLESRDSHTKQKLAASLQELTAMSKAGAKPKKAKKPIVLRVLSLLRPKLVSELDAVRAEQLRIAGDRWEGAERPAQERLTEVNEDWSFLGVCEWRVLGDAKGKARYDVWLHSGDAGTYYEVGSTVPIAEMIQRSVATLRDEDADTGLADALAEASTKEAGEGAPAAVATAKKAKPGKVKS